LGPVFGLNGAKTARINATEKGKTKKQTKKQDTDGKAYKQTDKWQTCHKRTSYAMSSWRRRGYNDPSWVVLR